MTFRSRLSGIGFVPYRLPWLLEHCGGRKVLDVGCAGAGYFEPRFRAGTALHPCLKRVTDGIVGVDIDGEALEVLRRNGCDQVIEADLSHCATSVIAETERHIGGCDVVLCGEVLEHVVNAGALLVGIRKVAKHFNAEVVLTVPNAFSLRGFLWLCIGIEAVHPDHKCYYSSHTIQSLLRRSGFQIVRVMFYADEVECGHGGGWSEALNRFLSRTVIRFLPQFGHGLIVLARSE